MRFRRGRRAAEELDEGDDEGKGFSGTGSSVHGYVFVAAEQRYGGSLNRRAELETGGGKGFQDRF